MSTSILAKDLGPETLAMPRALAVKWEALVSRLRAAARDYPEIAFASSLAAEDMVVTHAILDNALPVAVFTLDTGRLHAETLELIGAIQRRYGREIEIWRPDAQAVKKHVDEHGAYAFYESIALRKECCNIRKVEPLRRALAGRGAWVTGQRREQSVTRNTLAEEEYDSVFGLRKYNPLASWSHDEVWQATRLFDIPYNRLHDQGYPSIGCEPCTRAIKPGEDLRAGRWWWESASSKECGLHAGNLPAGSRISPVKEGAQADPQA